MSTPNRNIRGGKAYKKMKSGNVRRRSKNPDAPVDTTTGIDHYAIVIKRLGDNRILVKLDTGQEVQAVIPGRFRRKVWFNAGDYIQIQCSSANCYDVIQKIINENEKINAETAVGKEGGVNDIFMPSTEDPDNESGDERIDEEFDAFGNKLEPIEDTEDTQNDGDKQNDEKNQDEKLIMTKPNINADKMKRRIKEKERDIQRRSNFTKDYDIKPDSLISGSESE